MLDMSQTIIAKSDQLNADDLIGKTLTITITKVTGNDSAEQPVSVHYEGDNGKPFKPCKTIRRVMVAAWGANAADYAGRSMTLYRDATVKFGGMDVGGIRVSHMSHIDGKLVVVANATKGKKRPIEIMPLKAEVVRHPSSAGSGQPSPFEDDGSQEANGYADQYIEKLRVENDPAKVEAIRRGARKAVAFWRENFPAIYARVIEADPHSAIQPVNAEEAAAGNQAGDETADPAQPALIGEE